MSARIANLLVQSHVSHRHLPPVVVLLLAEEVKDHFKLADFKIVYEVGGKG